jgi:hypothetical protein
VISPSGEITGAVLWIWPSSACSMTVPGTSQSPVSLAWRRLTDLPAVT